MTESKTPNRIGHRHVFGVLVPDFNSVVEPELSDLRVAGVSNQTTRFPLTANVVDDICNSGERLAPSGVQSWIVGLSTESFPNGLDLMSQGAQSLSDRTKLPVYTAPSATRAALEMLSASRLGIVTPFDESANSHVRAVYESWGFEVVTIVGLARSGFDQIANTTDRETEAAFKRAAGDRVDTLVQVGGGLPMLHLIARLERQLGRPIIAANMAVYWQGLRAAGINDVIPNAGSLFEATP
jgi:maleate isomerase